MTHKAATILIATGGRTQVYRSLREVPSDMRKRLVETTSGSLSATLLIADEGGRREIMRSLQGRPSAIESRWIRSFNNRTRSGGEARPSRRWHLWAEIGLVGAIGLCLWMLAAWK